MFSIFSRSSFSGTDRGSIASSYELDEEFEMLVKAYMRDINYTTINQAAMNIACATVNAGLIALPFAAQEAGIPLYVASMLALTIIAGYTSILVVSMANERRVRTLEDLAECAFGVKGFFFVSIMQLLFSLSLMCVTLNVWADILSDVFKQSSINAHFLKERHQQLYIGAAIVLPFCILKKSLSQLRWTSFVTCFAVAGSLIAVVATYVSHKGMADSFKPNSAAELCRPKSYWWILLFTSVYSYSCNQKVLTIYSSLRRRTAERWQVAVQRALLAVFLLYTIFGVGGYLAKDSRDLQIEGFNFFLSDQHEIRAVFDPARCVVAFSLLLTMPVDCLIAATTWRRLWSKSIKHWHLADHLLVADAQGHMPSAQSLTCWAVCCTSRHSSNPHNSTGSSPGGSVNGIEVGVKDSEQQQQQQEQQQMQQQQRASGSSVLSSLSALLAPTSSNTSSTATVPQKHRRTYRAVRQHDADDEGEDEEVRRGGADEEEPRYTDDLCAADDDQDVLNALQREPQSPPQSGARPHTSSAATSGTAAAAYSGQSSSALRSLNATHHHLDAEQYQTFMDATSFLPERTQVVPTLFLWFLTILITLYVKNWLYLVASVGVIATLLLLFIIPALLYLKLGLVSDYQAQPVCSLVPWLLPNQLYASCLLLLGVLILLFDVMLDIYFKVTGARIVDTHSN